MRTGEAAGSGHARGRVLPWTGRIPGMGAGRPTTWRRPRRQVAAWAVLSAVATGALLVLLDPLGRTLGPAVYALVTVAAVFFPAGIAVQVVTGQVLVAGFILAPTGPDVLLLVPLVAGVVVTAELLAVVARLDTPVPCEPGGVAERAGQAAAIGGGTFVAVVLVSGVPGPTGILAVVLASGACVLLAGRLVRGMGGGTRP